MLRRNVQNSSTEGENAVRLVREFIPSCNGEQIRCALPTCKLLSTKSLCCPMLHCNSYICHLLVHELCHLFTNYIAKSGIPAIQGVKVLAHAVDKIRLYDSQLTPVHADLCQLSLCAKNFNPALKVLDIDVTAISTTEVNLTERVHWEAML